MVRGHKSASYPYDVFLNHRGPDTKNTLASNLYYRLRHRGLRVFLDKEEIQKGSRIDSVIKNVIKDTLVHVAIFSAGYAESEYCMDELLLMKESGSTIIPVYYNVNPTDMWSDPVNKRNGVYEESLRILKEEKIFDRETHEEKERYQSSDIEQWKKTLTEVTGRKGFKLETDDDEVTRLVDMIMEEVHKSKRKDFVRKMFFNTFCFVLFCFYFFLLVRKMLAAANGNAI